MKLHISHMHNAPCSMIPASAGIPQDEYYRYRITSTNHEAISRKVSKNGSTLINMLIENLPKA